MINRPLYPLIWTEIKQLLIDVEWSKDDQLTERRHQVNPLLQVYQLADGRVLDFIPNKRGYVYRSKEVYVGILFERRSMREFMDAPIQERESFLDEISSLIQQLPALLSLSQDDLDFSINSLPVVERAVNAIGRYKGMHGILFSALVAYVGEVIQANKSTKWLMVQFRDHWQPFLVTEDNRRYSPIGIVFDTFELVTDELVLEYYVNITLLTAMPMKTD